MNEKYELCDHSGPRIKDGRGLNRLTLCYICGQPIIEDILDVVAYLRNPRIIQNGKIIKKAYFPIDAKIDFICEHAKILHHHKKRKRGRPKKRRKEEEEEDEKNRFTYDEELLELSEPLGARTPGSRAPFKKYEREIKYRKLALKNFCKMMKYVYDTLREKAVASSFFIGSIWSVLSIFAKVGVRLKKKDVQAICCYFLTKEGVKLKDALRICKVGSHHTVKKWGERCEKILKKLKYYPKMDDLLLPSPDIRRKNGKNILAW